MHPLKKYLSNLRIASSTPTEYHEQLNMLAKKVGVSVARLRRLHYPGQTSISPEKGLRLELATNGMVPAHSVCESHHIVELVLKVMEIRQNNAGGGNGET